MRATMTAATRLFMGIAGMALCTMMLQMLFAVAASADPGSDELAAIEHIEAMAAKDRADADRQRQQAEKYRVLERDARATNARITDPARKLSGEKDADGYKRDAEEADARALKLDGYAERQENEAKQRRAALAAAPPPSPVPRDAAQASPGATPPAAADGASGQDGRGWPPVDSLLGTWVSAIDGSELKIEAIYPEDPSRKDWLTLTTRKHVYTGTYAPGASPKPARLSFRLRPKAAEMNSQIPLVARQKVESELEWVFELDEIDDCVCSGIKGRWYPGEITWSEEANGDARVSGKGDPIALEYKLKPPDPTEQVKAPELFLLSNNTRIAHFEPLQSAAFKSPFRIKVLLPPEIAQKQGAELTVELAAQKTWSTAQVTLRGSQLPSGVWSYISDPPVILVPVPTSGDTTWFRAENGELVTATYKAPGGMGSASEVFSIYQNDVYQALAQNEETLSRLDTTYELLLGNGVTFNDRPLLPREREILEQKRKLIQHAHEILGHGLVELVALAVGESYIRMVQSEPLNGANTPMNRGLDQSIKGLSFEIDWLDPMERLNVNLAVSEARDRYTDIFVALARDFGTDTFRSVFLGHFADVDDVRIIFTGTDFLGKSYDTSERVLAGIRLVKNIALKLIMKKLSADARYAKMPRAEAAREAWRSQRSAREQVDAALAASEVRIDSGFGPRVGATRKIDLLFNSRTPRAPGAEPAFHEDLDGLPSSARFAPDPGNQNPDPLFQCRGNVCALMSTVHAGKTLGRNVVTEERILARLADHFDLLSEKGMRSNMKPKLARLLGLDYDFERKMSLAEISAALRSGKAVVGGMHYLDVNGTQIRISGHAIHILEVVEASSTGQASYVKYWDPSTGRQIGMTACDFQKIYDPRDVLLIK